MTLTDLQREQAAEIARLTAGHMARDFGPMIVPDAASHTFAEIGSLHAGSTRIMPFYSTGPHLLNLFAQFTQRGSLVLRLDLEHQLVWAGELRRPPVAPDPRESRYLYICGRKGSGKSEYAKRWFYSYPFDRLALDITHDVTESLRADGIPHHQLTLPIPGSWPEWMRDAETEARQMTLVFRPDMGDPGALADIDRCIGLCMRGRDPGTGRVRPVLGWADEIGEVAPVHRTGPAMRRALHHGRHHALSLLMCGPEAKNVDPLCIAQADEVIAFRMLRAEHRKVLADNVGYGQEEFDAMNEALGRFEHMRWTTETETFEHMAPLPLWRRGRNELPEIPAPV